MFYEELMSTVGTLDSESTCKWYYVVFNACVLKTAIYLKMARKKLVLKLYFPCSKYFLLRKRHDKLLTFNNTFLFVYYYIMIPTTLNILVYQRERIE